MRSLLVFVALAVAAAWVAVRHLPEEAKAQPAQVARRQEIASVALDGRSLPAASLRALLSTQPGALIDREALTRDRAVLEEALEERGYLAAKVGEAKVTFDASGAAYVTFAIAQGPEFRIRSVTVTGAADKDAGVVTLGAGEVAIADRIARARAALAERLAARGKQALVVANVKPDLAAGVVDVELAAER